MFSLWLSQESSDTAPGIPDCSKKGETANFSVPQVCWRCCCCALGCGWDGDRGGGSGGSFVLSCPAPFLSSLLSAASPEPGGALLLSLQPLKVLSCTGEIHIHPPSLGILPGAVDAPWDPLSPAGAEQLQEFGAASGGTKSPLTVPRPNLGLG